MALPEPAYQNSAGRLLAILTSLPNNAAYIEAIPNLFGKDSKKPQEKQQACLAGLLDLHNLYVEFQQDMQDVQIPEQQRAVLLKGLAGLSQVFYPIQMNTAFRSPTDAEKSLLEVCATILSQEPVLQKDDIKAIRDSIVALRALVEDANISPTIRKVLLDLIRMSEDAISRFSIHGARGLRKAYKAMLAEALDTCASVSTVGEREELTKSNAWAAIVKHLKIIDTVASRLLKYTPVIEFAARLMLGGPPP